MLYDAAVLEVGGRLSVAGESLGKLDATVDDDGDAVATQLPEQSISVQEGACLSLEFHKMID